MAPHSLCYNKKTKQTSILKIINFKGSRDVSDKKLWNKFLVARANGIRQCYFWSLAWCGAIYRLDPYFLLKLIIFNILVYKGLQQVCWAINTIQLSNTNLLCYKDINIIKKLIYLWYMHGKTNNTNNKLQVYTATPSISLNLGELCIFMHKHESWLLQKVESNFDLWWILCINHFIL